MPLLVLSDRRVFQRNTKLLICNDHICKVVIRATLQNKLCVHGNRHNSLMTLMAKTSRMTPWGRGEHGQSIYSGGTLNTLFGEYTYVIWFILKKTSYFLCPCNRTCARLIYSLTRLLFKEKESIINFAEIKCITCRIEVNCIICRTEVDCCFLEFGYTVQDHSWLLNGIFGLDHYIITIWYGEKMSSNNTSLIPRPKVRLGKGCTCLWIL